MTDLYQPDEDAPRLGGGGIAVNNTEERTPCVLLIDVSGSMNNDGKIDQVNAGLKAFEKAMKADPVTASRVVVCVIVFGTREDTALIVQDWTDAEYFEAPTLEAWGMSPLGLAMNFALDQIDDVTAIINEEGLSFSRPWIFLLSDGDLTDDDDLWEEAAARASEAVDNEKVIIWALVTEPGSPEGLRPLVGTGDKSFNDVYDIQGVELEKLFVWLSTSLAAGNFGDYPPPGKRARRS